MFAHRFAISQTRKFRRTVYVGIIKTIYVWILLRHSVIESSWESEIWNCSRKISHKEGAIAPINRLSRLMFAHRFAISQTRKFRRTVYYQMYHNTLYYNTLLPSTVGNFVLITSDASHHFAILRIAADFSRKVSSLLSMVINLGFYV